MPTSTPVTTSTGASLIASSTQALNTNLGSVLPVVLVAAVALVVLFKALNWAFGAAHAR